jgi:N-methylhydantoinase B
MAGGYAIRRHNGRVQRLPGKAMNVALEPGDALIMRTTGGGGVGPPGERDPGLLEEDLRSGAVSRRAAVEQYGASLPRGNGKRPGAGAGVSATVPRVGS